MDQTRADFVIVGGGSAGAILATRLTEDPNCRVVLLEAGPDYPVVEELPEELRLARHAAGPEIAQGIHNWKFVARTTDTALPMRVARGKVTGGSSAINYGAYIRGVPEDYDAWASLGNDEWSFAKTLPYFRKVEKDLDFQGEFHGADGVIPVRRDKREEWLPVQMAFLNACRAAGFPESPDQNHPESTGVGPSPKNIVDGVRYSTAIAYLSGARERPNLDLRPDSMVHRILFDGRKATGVLVESGGEMSQVMADQVILSAGAVGSPHLLMLTGVGPAKQLTALGIPVIQDLPGVGRNLRDHPRVVVTWLGAEGFTVDPRASTLRISLRTTAPGSELRNDTILTMSPFTRQETGPGGNPTTVTGINMLAVLALAVGSGELKLASTDPKVQPVLDFNYLTDPFDRRRLRDAVRLCLRLAEQDDLKQLVARRMNPPDADLASDDALDAWMLREALTFSHISATCKMGPASDPLAAVDQYGVVRGLEGLRVVDASIMPDCVRANINATVMMMAERLADVIRQGSA